MKSRAQQRQELRELAKALGLMAEKPPTPQSVPITREERSFRRRAFEQSSVSTTTKRQAHGPQYPNKWRGQGNTRNFGQMVFGISTGTVVRKDSKGLTRNPRGNVDTGEQRHAMWNN